MEMLEIVERIIVATSPLILGLFGVFGKYYISKVDQKTQKIVEYFEINKESEDYIRQMSKIKDYYCNKIKDPQWRIAGVDKASTFINCLSKIIKTHSIELDHYEYIKNELNSGAEYVKQRMIEYLGKKAVNEFYSHHIYEYIKYLADIEELLSTAENHYKERFILLSNAFLKDFLIEIEKASRGELKISNTIIEQNRIKEKKHA